MSVVSLLRLSTLACLLGAGPTAGAAVEGAWQPLTEDAGVAVFGRGVANSKLIEFRSTVTLEAPILPISAVIWDANRACEWMAQCAQAFFLEKRNDHDAILYNRLKTAAIAEDRDVVLAVRVTTLAADKTVHFDFHDIADPRKPPAKGVTRMAKLDGSYTLRQLGPRRTEVTYQVMSDPVAGALPTWIINRFARDLPLDTLKALRRQVDRGGYDGVRAEVLRKLDWKDFDLGAPAAAAEPPGAPPPAHP